VAPPRAFPPVLFPVALGGIFVRTVNRIEVVAGVHLEAFDTLVLDQNSNYEKDRRSRLEGTRACGTDSLPFSMRRLAHIFAAQMFYHFLCLGDFVFRFAMDGQNSSDLT